MTPVQFPRLLIMLVFLLFAVIPASLLDAQNSPFEKGSRSVSLGIGSGQMFSNDYLIVGLGVGYYIFNGIEIGLDGEAWLGDDPGIYKLSPQVKYILPMQSRIRPYVGTFYRHVFINHYDDLDSIGGRGGGYFMPDKHWFIGVGGVYESYLNCDDTIYSSCDNIYTEITFSFSF